jgi:hypothetical protein
MIEIAYQDEIASAEDLAKGEPIFARIWLRAVVLVGLGLSAAWMYFLGHELVKLCGLALGA